MSAHPPKSRPLTWHGRLARALLQVFFAVLITAHSAPAQTEPSTNASEKGSNTVRLTVHPAPLLRPALRYKLLPTADELTDGPAVPLYLQAAELIRQRLDELRRNDPTFDVSDLFKLPLDQLATNPATQKLLDESQEWSGRPLELLALAARRRHVDWALPLREQGLATPMPYLYLMQESGDVVALAARVQIAGGKFDDAARTLQSGFALARSLREQSLPIQSWSEAGIAREMANQTQELIGKPGAPNLYWALATLPQPFIDPGQDARWERAAILLQFPALRDVAHATSAQIRSINEWRRQQDEPNAPNAATSQPSPWATREALARSGIYPQAKQYLVERGVSREQLDRDPVAEVVTRYFAMRLREALDDRVAWSSLPFPQAREMMDRAQDELSRQGQSIVNPFNRFIGRYGLSPTQYARLQRQLAALQTIEALRAYAADHNGALPASLDALKGTTPAPADPATDRPFEYHVEGRTVVLTGPSLEPRDAPERTLRYEITFAESK